MAKLINRLHAGAYTSLFGWLAHRRPPQPQPIVLDGKSRVLLFTCAGIGDTLTDTVVFKALAETWPGIHLAAVVHRRRRVLADHNPYVSQVFPFSKGPLSFWLRHRALKAAGPWDAIIHLRGNDPEPRCHSYLLNPDVTISIPSMTQISWLCGHNLPQPDWSDTHGVAQTLRITDWLGAKTEVPTLVYEVRADEKDAMRQRLAELNVPAPDSPKSADSPRSAPLIVMQIGGGRRASWRDWPEHCWAELIEAILQDAELPRAHVLLLSGKDNLPRARQLIALLTEKKIAVADGSPAQRQAASDNSPRVHNLVGQLSLTQSAALVQSARLLVSTDTGMMHMGFAVGARVVALIHCNNPQHRVGPYGYGDRHRVVQLPRPDGYQSPADADMADITIDAVLPEVRRVWADGE